VQADRLPRQRAKLGKTLVMSSGGGGVVRPIGPAWCGGWMTRSS